MILINLGLFRPLMGPLSFSVSQLPPRQIVVVNDTMFGVFGLLWCLTSERSVYSSWISWKPRRG